MAEAGRDEGQDRWGAAGRQGGLWGVGLEGDLRNTNVVMENCPLPQKRRKLEEKLPVCAEGQKEGVKFRAVMGCSLYAWLQTPALRWPAGLVPVTPPCVGGISPISLQLPCRAELLAVGVRGILQRQECHQHRWL